MVTEALGHIFKEECKPVNIWSDKGLEFTTNVMYPMLKNYSELLNSILSWLVAWGKFVKVLK